MNNMSHPDARTFWSAGVADTDPEIAEAIGLELGRQRREIELIASENIVSRAVMEAQGSSPINTQKGIRGGVITAAASMSTSQRISRLIARASFLAVISPTYSRTPALRRTRACFRR